MKNKLIKIGISLLFGILVTLIALTFILKKSNLINIAYMIDAKYLPYMQVSLHSAIIHKKTKSQYIVHVIAKDFTPADEKKLKQMEQENVKINIYPAKDLNLDYSHLGRFNSFQISLQKLFIADYLKNVAKVLYLDADTLVQKDLSKIYNTPLQSYYVAAVKDGLMYQHPDHITEIGLDWRNFYFNSGVMLLNLNKIREDNLLRRAVIYFNTHEEVFGDQDILNVIVKDKVLPISYKYNTNPTFFEEKDATFLSKFYNETVPQTPREVYDMATILHFAGYKPWTQWFNHSYLKPLWQSYKEEMEKYLHK